MRPVPEGIVIVRPRFRPRHCILPVTVRSNVPPLENVPRQVGVPRARPRVDDADLDVGRPRPVVPRGPRPHHSMMPLRRDQRVGRDPVQLDRIVRLGDRHVPPRRQLRHLLPDRHPVRNLVRLHHRPPIGPRRLARHGGRLGRIPIRPLPTPEGSYAQLGLPAADRRIRGRFEHHQHAVRMVRRLHPVVARRDRLVDHMRLVIGQGGRRRHRQRHQQPHHQRQQPPHPPHPRSDRCPRRASAHRARRSIHRARP